MERRRSVTSSVGSTALIKQKLGTIRRYRRILTKSVLRRQSLGRLSLKACRRLIAQNRSVVGPPRWPAYSPSLLVNSSRTRCHAIPVSSHSRRKPSGRLARYATTRPSHTKTENKETTLAQLRQSSRNTTRTLRAPLSIRFAPRRFCRRKSGNTSLIFFYRFFL